MGGTNGCREQDRCLAACSGFDGSIGFESDGSMRCVAIVFSMPLVGRPAFPFIGQRKARVIVEEEKRTRGRSPLGLSGPSSPSSGLRRPCRCQQGRLHVMALFVTGALHKRHLPVMTFHSVPTDIVVNWRACQRPYEN